MLSCVVNLSEGRDAQLLASLGRLAGSCLLDLHRDGEHHRSVLTLGGASAAEVEEAARAVVAGAVAELGLAGHAGVHPRLGVADVVPFVPLLPGAAAAALGQAGLGEAVAARDRFAAWAGAELALPCFLYGPGGELEALGPSLPRLRREAFASLGPHRGPAEPHPSAGACCVGARRVLLAYNLLLVSHDLALGRRLAGAIRSPSVRALAFPLAAGVQVSCNLVAPWAVGPLQLYRQLATLAKAEGVALGGAELVGLLPEGILQTVPERHWAELGLGEEQTLEARLAAGRQGGGGGS